MPTLHNPPDNFDPAPFEPPFWLANPHLQTILPKLFAPKPPPYRRDIKKDSLDESDIAYDFYDASAIDTKANTTEQAQTPLVALFHGMEGSSDSHYARTLAYQAHDQGWHFVVPHFRSCGGIPASGRVFYNAGDTAEIHHMLQLLAQDYAHIYAVGVSLGGNALAKYMGEYGDKAICKAAVAVSAPVDMSSAAYAMQRFISQRVYTPYLLNPILKKVMQHDISQAELDAIESVERISDFDHIFTAPRHGYRSNIDYYHRASALPYLIEVTQPLLLISAKDDPFIGFTATPNDVSDSVTILDTEHGGHIGYLRYRSNIRLNNTKLFNSKLNTSNQVMKNTRPDTNLITQQFDINWIPETITAYFKAVGIDYAINSDDAINLHTHL